MDDTNPKVQSSGLYSLERKVLWGFGIAAAVLIVIGAFSYWSVVRFRMDAHQVDHTHQVLNALTELLTDLAAAESSERGFLLTGSDDYQQSFETSARQTDGQLRHIRELTSDNTAQQMNIAA